MKFWMLFILLFSSCVNPCPCDEQVDNTIDSLKSIYEELKTPNLETVSTAKEIVYTDGLRISEPTSDTERIFTRDGKTAYYDTRTDRYTVYCGKKNIDCTLEGSLYTNRISKNTGELYKSYLTPSMKAKIVYDEN